MRFCVELVGGDRLGRVGWWGQGQQHAAVVKQGALTKVGEMLIVT